jgi:GNAT superfamily N-acetyltransferase
VPTTEIREAQSRAEFDAFVEAAHRANAGSKNYVPLLRDEMHWAFDKKKSPLVQENDVRAFVAFRDGVPVGRIASIVNHAHLAKYQDATGHFGLLQGIDDPTLFKALLERVAEDLRTKGMRRMQGPFSLTINHETGILIEGFDEPHVVRTNYSPPYYGRYIEAAGFQKSIDLLAAHCVVAQSDFPARVARLAEKSGLSKELKTYGLTYADWRRKFQLVLALYNDAWAENWGSIPVSPAEGKWITGLVLPVSKPAWARIAEWRGEPIAVVSQIPDVNEATADLDGRLMPFGWAKLMWRIHVAGTKRSRVPMIGVARKWRGTRVGSLGVSMLLAQAIEQARKAGVEDMEISWMLETNHAVLNLVENLPAKVTRKFRVYEKPL